MEQVFGSIPAALNDLGPNAAIDEAIVLAAWKRCAGESLSERTRAIGFAQKKLIVGVIDNMWRRHLEELSPQLIAGINGNLGNGTLRFIEFQVAPQLFAYPALNSTDDGVDESLVPDRIISAAANIADEGLRKQFISAAADFFLKQKRD
jgi:hypothetical protein